MPHDKNGKELQVGDIVKVEFRVERLDTAIDYCNVSLKSVILMPPLNAYSSDMSSINTRQVEFVSREEISATIDHNVSVSDKSVSADITSGESSGEGKQAPIAVQEA